MKKYLGVVTIFIFIVMILGYIRYDHLLKKHSIITIYFN